MVDEPQVLMSHHRAWSNEWLWNTDSFISGEGSSQTAIPSRLAKLFDLVLSGDKLGIHLAVKSFEPTNRQHREIWKIFDRVSGCLTRLEFMELNVVCSYKVCLLKRIQAQSHGYFLMYLNTLISDILPYPSDFT
ncbi:hypothetical protein MG293_003861 [Ovis ammon polii]|uniref:Uncharacterized protein n=1 Tax=Ovis ammon polii TaxID=230172 RepID=A0AAD4ULA7_OVIAM|nr:hypothetical protein MG293_003861 [Ovis ammon polii]